MLSNKKAFTMIELVFVIVVLGILSAIALPKFAATRTDAIISKGRADISSIRSAIMTERQSRLIMGDNKFIAAGSGIKQLDDGSTADATGPFFGGVLTYSIAGANSSGHWHTRSTVDTNSSTINYKIKNTDVLFTYTRGNGVFTCVRANTYCKDLID